MTDVELALLNIYAEDSFSIDQSDKLDRALDPRVGPAAVRGWITGRDSVLGAGARKVFYGWLIEPLSGQFTAVIRGTGDGVEWFEDAEWLPSTPHPDRGRVEVGFWELYQTMQFLPADSNEFLPLAEGLMKAVGDGEFRFTGHSLGAALTTFGAYDCAPLGKCLTAVLFASPHPGDLAFGTEFGVRVPQHRSYWWAADMVPRVPFGFGYAALPRNIELIPPPGLTVCRSLTCAHHALTYAAMQDPTVLKRFIPTPPDLPFLKCLTTA